MNRFIGLWFVDLRFPREQQALPDQMQYAEFERHTSEIAAFHLDR